MQYHCQRNSKSTSNFNSISYSTHFTHNQKFRNHIGHRWCSRNHQGVKFTELTASQFFTTITIVNGVNDILMQQTKTKITQMEKPQKNFLRSNGFDKYFIQNHNLLTDILKCVLNIYSIGRQKDLNNFIRKHGETLSRRPTYILSCFDTYLRSWPLPLPILAFFDLYVRSKLFARYMDRRIWRFLNFLYVFLSHLLSKYKLSIFWLKRYILFFLYTHTLFFNFFLVKIGMHLNFFAFNIKCF